MLAVGMHGVVVILDGSRGDGRVPMSVSVGVALTVP